jgi:hypothetical protein
MSPEPDAVAFQAATSIGALDRERVRNAGLASGRHGTIATSVRLRGLVRGPKPVSRREWTMDRYCDPLAGRGSVPLFAIV